MLKIMGHCRSAIVAGIVVLTGASQAWAQFPILAADLNTNPVSAPSFPGLGVVHNGAMYFSADNGVDGMELWRLQDTGPLLYTRLTDVNKSGYSTLSDNRPVVYNGEIYFDAYDGGLLGSELYKYTPGSPGSVSLVMDIRGGSFSSQPQQFAVYQGELYMNADAGTVGAELYKYNSSTNTLSLIDDLVTGSFAADPDELTVFNNRLYFVANTDTNGRELHFHDATTNTTSMVANIEPGAGGSNPSNLTVFNNELYFSAFQTGTGHELWKYTPGSGVSHLTNLNASNPSSVVANEKMVEYKGELYFIASDAVPGQYDIFKYDPNSNTTTKVTDNQLPSFPANPTELTVFDGKIYFSGFDPINGKELWVYDGSTASMVHDLNFGTNSSSPHAFTVYGNKLFFAADDGVHGVEHYFIEGTSGPVVPAPAALAAGMVAMGCIFGRRRK